MQQNCWKVLTDLYHNQSRNPGLLSLTLHNLTCNSSWELQGWCCDFSWLMKRSHTHRQVCAEAETTQGSSTCCSFVAEACARQPPLFQLFPDVCFLSLPPLNLALLFFHLSSDSSSASFSVLCRTHLTEAYVSYILTPAPVCRQVSSLCPTRCFLRMSSYLKQVAFSKISIKQGSHKLACCMAHSVKSCQQMWKVVSEMRQKFWV